MWGFGNLYANQAQVENMTMRVILESAMEATYVIEVEEILKEEKQPRSKH